MKLLLFSDLHMDERAAERLVDMAREVDVVVGAGDFGNQRKGASVCIDILNAIEKPAVLVPGNNESFEELKSACAGAGWKSAIVLHGTGIDIDGIPFFGVGGGIPRTPFGSWSYDYSEIEAGLLLRNCPSNGVLVSHSPPKGYVDVSSSRQSLGSEAVLEASTSNRLRLVVCGHIHASAGQQAMVRGTTIVNAGPNGIVMDLPEQVHE